MWLLTGVVLFSAMARLHPRYVESFTPAVAAMLGIGVAWVAGLGSRARLLALGLPALLIVPLVASVEAVSEKTSDAGNVGALAPAEQRALSAYLLARQANARYELAAGSSTTVASLIVQDRRPVLMLTTYNGLSFTSVAHLKALIARGEVRYAFLDSVCSGSTQDDSRLRTGGVVDTRTRNRRLSRSGPAERIAVATALSSGLRPITHPPAGPCSC